jgi:hypothetical protein
VEAAVALSILTLIGLVMLQLSSNSVSPRQWSLHQALMGACMNAKSITVI